MARLSSKQFFNLLRKRNGANRAAIDKKIEASGTESLSILVSDSSGFSRKTHQYGILQFLAVMTQCYDRLIPLVEKRHGECLVHNADNILAVFHDPAHAVAAAIDMHRWLAKRNKSLPEADQFNICIGIHHGPVLRLTDNIYGDRVNVAAKIGEDVAGKDEILITRDVTDRIKGRFKYEYSRSTELGGKRFELFTVRY